MALGISDPDFWTRALQFTPTIHRDIYPAIAPESDRARRVATDKVVVVTGAGSGFGKGACLQWARSSAKAIVLAGRRRAQLDEVVSDIAASSSTTQTTAVQCDVSNYDEVKTLFETAAQSYGKVDVLVHAAGVLGPVTNVGDAPVDEWWSAFEINAKGAFLVARELVRQNEAATFINTGTAASYFANPGQSSYTMSKLAVNMLLEQLNAEYSNLRVFNVHPGMAKSSVLRPELEIYAKDTPELFGSTTVWLAGEEAEFLRGRFVAVNWDVDELVQHQKEIVEEGLLKSQPFKGNIGSGGHFRS
ncbi:uncharacterized protein A1O9_11218 [Exophiala aquamarina CBS 119918]|uniref:Ketoreductase domain-containing protein n=1 Tax=Exophiala aquamarina CBS 119918 TaxID=1182545 RepID=A0A072NZ16_9EURO|nr:uncharacterized protein A1O9_11218 [Exophiala aquamarina CBS 119918]KEF52801.1 hypothetical protein A1O9_11218 [Exophiala aquamarina CBS 119918]